MPSDITQCLLCLSVRRNIVDKLKVLKKSKNKTDVLDLLTARNDLKKKFITKKQAARTNIDLLRVKNEGLAALKDRGLKEKQVSRGRKI
jgi:hypothetical protein